jgi:hypothetical protein
LSHLDHEDTEKKALPPFFYNRKHCPFVLLERQSHYMVFTYFYFFKFLFLLLGSLFCNDMIYYLSNYETTISTFLKYDVNDIAEYPKNAIFYESGVSV